MEADTRDNRDPSAIGEWLLARRGETAHLNGSKPKLSAIADRLGEASIPDFADDGNLAPPEERQWRKKLQPEPAGE